MNFFVKIRTDNAAFDGADLPYEIGHILNSIPERMVDNLETEGVLHDSNGNRVGTFGFATVFVMGS